MADPNPIDNSASEKTVKCPQCGKTASRDFPFCEFCTFPIGEMLQHRSSPDFIANALKKERQQNAHGRRHAIDHLRVSRGTTVRIAGLSTALCCVLGIGYFLIDVRRAHPDVIDGSARDNTHRDQSVVTVVVPEPTPSPVTTTVTPVPSPKPVTTHLEPAETPPVPTAPVWAHPKNWYQDQANDMQRKALNYCYGGYVFDMSKASSISQQLKVLQNAISRDDADACRIAHDELVRRFQDFAQSCQWRQGLKHRKHPHIVSSYRPDVWDAEEGFEFVNPGTSDLTVREKVQQLQHSHDWYVRECDVISQNVQNLRNGPYFYDSRKAQETLTRASQLRAKIYTERPNVVDKLCAELQNSYREFRATCRWRAGVRHPSFAHVISSTMENTWNAESGWEFVNPGTSDLSVRRSVTAQPCRNCRGYGRVIVKHRCGRCNGNDRIKNPASEVGQAVKDVVGIFGGRNARRISNIPTGPAYILCPDCGGRRYVQQETPCNGCGGSGKTYK